jgi:DnaK suppressor protein
MDLTGKQLAELKRIIKKRRELLIAEIQGDVAKTRDQSYGELAGVAPDTGDESVADLLADLDNAEVSRDLQELRELEAAQGRIARGGYGDCAECGATIEFDRLRAYPIAIRCIDCQRVHEKTYAHANEPTL